jgi:UPF0271 protein
VGSVDLNSDLGESYGVWTLGDDEAMLAVVSSANVACGFHAGDPSTLRAVCRAAAQRQVAIGAQVSFPDLLGFGRRHLSIEPDALEDLILYQIGALDGLARAAGTRVSYVKPHGALYHAAHADPAQAQAIVEAARSYSDDLAILGLPDSALLMAADRAGLNPVAEAFADRAYRRDGSLVPRSEPDSVLSDPELIAARILHLVERQEIVTIDGDRIPLRAESICIHSDTDAAVEIAIAVRRVLSEAGVSITSFADDG